jgi:hypothetical protein
MLSRKDKATNFTRKVTLEDPCNANLRPYPGVTEAVLAAPCFVHRRGAHLITNALRTLTTRESSPTPLHVSLHVGPPPEFYPFHPIFEQGNSARPVRFEIFDLGDDRHAIENLDELPILNLLRIAFVSRSVVHFAANGSFGPNAAGLADFIFQILTWSTNVPSLASGRLYLCGIPELMFSAGRLARLGSGSNEAARRALCHRILAVWARWPVFAIWSKEQNTTYFDSKIELVDPGFKPPLSNMVVETA